MALQGFQHLFSPLQENKSRGFPLFCAIAPVEVSFPRMECCGLSSNSLKVPFSGCRSNRGRVRASKPAGKVGSKKKVDEYSDDSDDEDSDFNAKRAVNDPYLMTPEERREWRMNIREVMRKYPDAEEELDPHEKKAKMEKLLADYPLVVEEEDPDWPDDADGRGFKFDQFFDKITINNVKKDDDENYDSDNEIVWKDDNYIVPIKDIKTADWELTVFKDISPLIILMHNRYKRPKENERARDELEKAVHIIWNCRLPSPRIVAVDAVVELDLVSALKVSSFPEIIFTKAGKILYREKAIRSADEFSKMMAFFYYGAAKPPCLSGLGDTQELIPSIPISSCASLGNNCT